MNTTKRDVKNENLYFMQSVDGQKVCTHFKRIRNLGQKHYFCEIGKRYQKKYKLNKNPNK